MTPEHPFLTGPPEKEYVYFVVVQNSPASTVLTHSPVGMVVTLIGGWEVPVHQLRQCLASMGRESSHLLLSLFCYLLCSHQHRSAKIARHIPSKCRRSKIKPPFTMGQTCT